MRHAALMRRAFVGTVQKVERCEIVGTAVVVLATFACSEHQSGILTGCRLARLNVHAISVHRDLSGYSDPTRVGSKVIALRREAKRIGEKLQLAPHVAVESTLCLMVVGNRRLKSNAEDILGMVETPRANRGQAQRRALFHPRAPLQPGRTLTLKTDSSSPRY